MLEQHLRGLDHLRVLAGLLPVHARGVVDGQLPEVEAAHGAVVAAEGALHLDKLHPGVDGRPGGGGDALVRDGDDAGLGQDAHQHPDGLAGDAGAEVQGQVLQVGEEEGDQGAEMKKSWLQTMQCSSGFART